MSGWALFAPYHASGIKSTAQCLLILGCKCDLQRGLNCMWMKKENSPNEYIQWIHSKSTFGVKSFSSHTHKNNTFVLCVVVQHKSARCKLRRRRSNNEWKSNSRFDCIQREPTTHFKAAFFIPLSRSMAEAEQSNPLLNLKHCGFSRDPITFPLLCFPFHFPCNAHTHTCRMHGIVPST